jgi:hypothetical protein
MVKVIQYMDISEFRAALLEDLPPETHVSVAIVETADDISPDMLDGRTIIVIIHSGLQESAGLTI